MLRQLKIEWNQRRWASASAYLTDSETASATGNRAMTGRIRAGHDSRQM